MSRRTEQDVEARLTQADDLADEQSDGDKTARPEEQITEIRQSIEHTRAGMSETIDELQERLSPSHLKEQVKEQVLEQYRQARETVREATIGKVQDMAERVSDTIYGTRRTVIDTVTANPIPSALVGIGLVWLWMNRRTNSAERRQYDDSPRRVRRYDDTGHRYGSTGSASDWQQSSREEWERGNDAAPSLVGKTASAISGAADQIQEVASNLAGKTKATVSGVVEQAQASAGHFVDQAQYQAQRAEERFAAVLRENPLAVGAVALALGTAVGLAVPQTRKENEWMGEARDTLVDKAQSVAQDAIDQVQQVAQKVTDEITSSARPQ